MKYFKLIAASLLMTCSVSFAATSPIAVSVVHPIQFPPANYNVTGLRLSLLWGSHRDFYGIDLGGVGNITTQKFHGAALSGLFNYTQNNTLITGFQVAGLTNYNLQKTSVYGLQLAMVANYNKAASSVAGVQVAAFNLSTYTDVYGVQVGLYNRAKEVVGLQLGVVNVADNLHGLQIGLLNFHHTGLFYVAPIVNFGF
jgi:hypothetical protein